MAKLANAAKHVTSHTFRHFTETELGRPLHIRLIHKTLSVTTVLFGLVTIIAGTRVLSGSDLGYNVSLPLLLYNTVMGVAYIAAGVITWSNLDQGRYAAAAIFVLNFLVLGIIGYLYTVGTSVAIESVYAMIFRAVVWFVVFLGLAWLRHKRNSVASNMPIKRMQAADASRWP